MDVATVESANVFWGMVTGLSGLIFGLGGLILGAVNYIREKPNVHVTLKWDMESFGSGEPDTNKLYCLIIAANVGRRPVFISHAHIKIKGKTNILFVNDSLAGIKLNEGDAPKIYSIEQKEILSDYSIHWKKMYAVVIDSAGKEYRSKPTQTKPKWFKIHKDKDL